MNFPKEWTKTILGLMQVYQTPQQLTTAILNNLHLIGALKDPPKPREVWWCPCCNYSHETQRYNHNDSCDSIPIRMREVEEE